MEEQALIIDRLPKWAREKIKQLERERNEAINALHQFSDSQTESLVSYSELLSTGESRGPTKYVRFIHSERIEFKLGRENACVSIDGSALRVSSNTGTIKIQPEAANVVKIWSARHE